MHSAVPDDLVSLDCETQVSPSHPPSPPENSPPSHPCPAFDATHTHHTIPQADFQSRIPLDKPPEVETLLNSQLRFIPLLLWISRDSELVPYKLPPEYVYLCLGLFFISDLHVSCGHLTLTAIDKINVAHSDPA